MRVCFDARTAQPRFPGIGRYAFNLARSLARELSSDEHLHVLRGPSGSAAQRIAALSGDRVDSEPLAASPLSLHQQWAVPHAIRQSRCAIYHSPYIGMPLHPGVPTVVTIHDLIPLRTPHEVSTPRRVALRMLLRKVASRADAIIAPSEQTSRDLRELLAIPSRKIHVIPYAPDPDLVASAAAAAERPRDLVLCVGSARPHKNQLRLVQAWAAVGTSFPLVLAGPGQTSSCPAAREARALGLSDRIRFVGEVSDEELGQLYRRAIVLAFPSEIEGFGLPLVEAMACGAVVCCSDIPVLREVAGDAAAFFPPRDVPAMSDVLSSLLSTPSRLERLSRAGVESVRRFTWEQAARRTLEVYRSLISIR